VNRRGAPLIQPEVADKTLVVVAHPDDETIGAAVWISKQPGVWVVHVTDGAPADPRMAPVWHGSREGYARARAAELASALGLAGVEPEHIRGLGVMDQEAARALAAIASALAAIIVGLGPAMVLTQPYEGGHPDHDATAFAVHAALRLCQAHGARAPELAEMTSYHAPLGRLVVSEFLPSPEDLGEKTWVLSPAERQLKRRMLACYATQRDVLAAFPSEVERFRRAPRYDFTRPPHAGPTYYERLGWPMTSRRFCQLAARASHELGLS
jgi:LmbE family N-acetylglucosaminyl deacetylase